VEINLNQEWKWVPDHKDIGEKSEWFLSENFPENCIHKNIPVYYSDNPFENAKSAWLKNEFIWKQNNNNYVYLVFFGTDKGKIWLNDKYIGEMKRTSGKQVFDVSQFIQEKNNLVLKFEDIQENTAGIWKDVYVLDGASVPDIAKKFAPVNSKWLDNAILYSVNTKKLTKEGSLSALIRKLPYLKNIGINTLLFNPIYQEIQDKSGQSADYLNIDPQIGDKDIFRKLISVVHEFEMKIILDLPAGNYIKNNDNLQQVMNYWVREFNIDGYRCYSADSFSSDFWLKSISSLRGIKKDVIMIADSDNPQHSIIGFDMISDRNFMGVIDRIHQGYYQIDEISNYVHSQYQYYPQNSRRMISIENQEAVKKDTNPKNRNFIPLHFIKFFIPGVPLILNSKDQPLDISKEDMLFRNDKDILALRKKAKPLNSHALDSFSFNKGLYYYEIIRSNLDKTVHAIFNIDENSVTILNNGRLYKTIKNID
jgi:hypothetical protein